MTSGGRIDLFVRCGYVGLDLEKWDGRGRRDRQRVALHEPLQYGVRFAGGWVVCRMGEVWMVSQRNVAGGWVDGIMVHRLRHGGVWGGTVLLQCVHGKFGDAILESHQQVLPMHV